MAAMIELLAMMTVMTVTLSYRTVMIIIFIPIYVLLQLSLMCIIKMAKTTTTMQVEMLRSWEGDKKKLGNAERFILQLIGVQK
jgi:hypothetical protein